MTAKPVKYLGLWAALDKYPPYYVRLMAKRADTHAKDPLLAFSDAEIAIASGLTLTRVREISRLSDWQSVTVAELNTFTAACNFDPTIYEDRRRVQAYEYACKKRHSAPFQYLKRHPKWESEFLPLVKLLMFRLGFCGASPTQLSPVKR